MSPTQAPAQGIPHVQATVLCSSVDRKKRPCRGHALKGTALCRWHTQVKVAEKQGPLPEALKVPSLTKVLRLDFTQPASVDYLRRSLMRHVAKGTLDSSAAKSIHDMAVAILASARPADTGFADLATQIARELGNPRGEGGETTK